MFFYILLKSGTFFFEYVCCTMYNRCVSLYYIIFRKLTYKLYIYTNSQIWKKIKNWFLNFKYNFGLLSFELSLVFFVVAVYFCFTIWHDKILFHAYAFLLYKLLYVRWFFFSFVFSYSHSTTKWGVVTGLD